ncbi:MAG: lamin tail domain-containing protein [Akkermansiaceae bacterium]
MRLFLSLFLALTGLPFSSLTSDAATLAHRWSFTSNTEDSVAGNTGVLQGGASVSSTQLILPGLGTGANANRMTFSSPVNIGSNFGDTGVTIETWYTDSGTGTWGKLFQFGNNSAGQELGYTHTRGNGQQSGVDRDGAQLLGEQVTQNEEHHLVITISPNGNLNTWVDGVQKLTNTNTNDLSNVTTAFEAIGATSWNDPGMSGSVNEFRIWSGELTASEVTASLNSGPEDLPGSGPIITSFAGAHSTRQEGESSTLTWIINDTNISGTLSVEIRDPSNTVIHSSSNPSSNTPLTIGDTGGTAQTFTYTLRTWDSDTPGDVRTRSVEIDVTPGIPTATPQSLQTTETTPLNLTLSGNDPNNHPSPSLTYTVASLPSQGSLNGTPPNLTYTANNGFIGTDSFTFTVNDGKYDSPAVTISIEVLQAPTAPTSLTLSSLEIPSNVPLGGYLATLSTVDPNPADTHTYNLVAGAGSTHNNLFSIVSNQLRANSGFSGETGNSFGIRLRTSDQTGRSLEQSFSMTVVDPPDDIVINELHVNPPDNHIPLEFVELYNPSASPKNLTGWRFSSAIDFDFPAGTTIPAGGYLVVAENPSDLLANLGVSAIGPFAGNLSSSGETVRLRDAADNVIDEVDFKVGFPWPVASDGGGPSLELINPALDNSLGSSWRPSIPKSSLPPLTYLSFADRNWSWRPGDSEASNPTSDWTLPGFTLDGSWTSNIQTPIGYGNVGGIALNTIVPDMRDTFNCIFLRNTFTIAPGEIPSALELNFTIDDGVIIWINGQEVERLRFDDNEDPTIDDSASSLGTEGALETATLLNAGSYLVEGVNTIAVQVFNQNISSSDLEFDLELKRTPPVSSPTPGGRNHSFANNAAPNIRKVNHTPEQPTSTDPVLVTALVTDSDAVSSVSLEYQVVAPGSYVPSKLPLPIVNNNISIGELPDNPDFNTGWITLPMVDNGSAGDLLGGDDIYSSTLPANPHRHLVRYRIIVTDSLGESATVPYDDDPSLNFAYFVYNGVPAYQGIDAATMGTSLPVYHLLTRSADYAEAIAYNSSQQINQGTEARFFYNWTATMVYDGKVYDNIRYRLRGANGRYQGRGKRSMRVRFNDGNFLEARDQNGEKFDEGWRTLTLGKGQSNRGTMTYGLNEAVNYHLFAKMGVPSATPLFIQWRVVDDAQEAPDQWRGDYHGTYFVSETYDVRFLDEHNLEKGNLYKLINQTTNWKKQQRYQGKFAPFNGSDHNTIESNLDGNDTPQYVDAHVNLEKYYAYHAMSEAIRHYDYWPSANKNMVYYFEPDYLPANNNQGKLWILPWDTDSTWGPSWNSGHDVVYNALFDAAGGGSDNASNPTLWPGYYNTVREMRDLLWQQPELEQVIDDFAAIISPLAPADFARWKNAPSDAGNYNHLGGPGINSLDAYVQDMKNFAFTGGSWPGGNDPVLTQARDNSLSGTQGRDAYLDFLQGNNGEGSLIPSTPTLTYTGPASFPTNALTFQSSSFGDPQGSETFGAMEWRLALIGEPGSLEIDSTWESGPMTTFSNTVKIPTATVRSGSIYRVRVRHQDDTGRWSHWSSPIEFATTVPDLSIYLDNLVISEVMYHPTDPTLAEAQAGFNDDDYFEYLELQNVGSTPLNLTDLRFTKGVDFDFINSPVTTLPAGATILVVRSIPAFQLRYGNDHLIAGEWDPDDKLNNASDRVKLSFGAGDTIRDFTYLDSSPWPAQPDGSGPSLTLIEPSSVPDHALASSWRSSYSQNGTPGEIEPTSPFETWLAAMGESDPSASYQGSSLSNLLAFGLGADLAPGLPPESVLPKLITVEDGGNTYPALEFRVRNGSEELDFVVETSTDMSLWQNGSPFTQPHGTPVDNGDGTTTHIVRSTSNQPRLFLRLRISLN